MRAAADLTNALLDQALPPGEIHRRIAERVGPDDLGIEIVWVIEDIIEARSRST